MKKSQTKALKHLANKLPQSFELIVVGSLVSGKLINEANKNEELNSGKFYRHRKRSLVPIDHFSRLKKAYARYKEQGIIDYIQWVNENNKRLNKLSDELKLEEVSEDVMDIDHELIEQQTTD